MHKNLHGPQHVETKWFYCGPDAEKYGPYMSKDMLFWLQAGYFTNELLVRTDNEQTFHSLGEWTALIGTHPFSNPYHSFEATVQQVSASRQPSHGPHGPPMMVMPPGLGTTFPQTQMPMRFPYVPIPLLHQMNNSQMIPMQSQPPSEPVDAGSLSHTPDSDNETRFADQNAQQHPAWLVALGLAGHLRKPQLQPSQLAQQHHPQQHQHSNGHMMPAVQRMADAHTATEPIVMKNAECQTDPLKLELTKNNASRLLSELFGQIVVIN